VSRACLVWRFEVDGRHAAPDGFHSGGILGTRVSGVYGWSFRALRTNAVTACSTVLVAVSIRTRSRSHAR
jgi:hypothetical protein